MELTWIAIAASLAMGLGAAFLFVFAVKRDWFRDIEEAKYQVFWSDPDINEGGPPGRFAPSASPLVLPHVVAGQSPATTSDLNEGGPPGRFAPSASPLVLPHVVTGQSPATTSEIKTNLTTEAVHGSQSEKK